MGAASAGCRHRGWLGRAQLVAAGVGVALLPTLTIAELPAGVRIARTRTPLQRHIVAARRVSMRGDSGLDRMAELLTDAAHARVRCEVPGRPISRP
jgi:DNA-binding transcriptional LysR family regulator